MSEKTTEDKRITATVSTSFEGQEHTNEFQYVLVAGFKPGEEREDGGLELIIQQMGHTSLAVEHALISAIEDDVLPRLKAEFSKRVNSTCGNFVPPPVRVIWENARTGRAVGNACGSSQDGAMKNGV